MSNNDTTQTRSDISSATAKRGGEDGSGSASRCTILETTSDSSDCHLQYQDGGMTQYRNLKGRGVTRVGRSYRAECVMNSPGMAGICLEFRKCGDFYVLQNVDRHSEVSVNNVPLSFGEYRRVKAGDHVSLPGVKMQIVRGVKHPLVDVSYWENPEVRRRLAAREAI